MSKQAAKQESQEATNSRDLQIELLNEKLKNLEGKVTKPKSSEEEFQERVARYEAKQTERNELKAQIEKRRMQILQEMGNGKMRIDEASMIESWERRIRECESLDPKHAQHLRYRIKEKIKEINSDSTR